MDNFSNIAFASAAVLLVTTTVASARDTQSVAALPAANSVALAVTEVNSSKARLRALPGVPVVSRGGPGCGDGLPGVGEACDDGNLITGDGCSDVCTVEVPFSCTGASGTSAASDSGFELGGLGTGDGIANPFWSESTTATLTPICTAADCQPQLAGLAIEGSHFLWFGAGFNAVATVSQDVTINAGDELSFWSLRGICDSVGTDNLVADIDGTPVLTIPCSGPGDVDADWVFNSAGLAPFDDGGVHTLTLTGTTTATDTGVPDFSNIFVDFVNVGPVSAEPSVCTSACGNGLPDGTEECDDGNVANGDGCSSACEVEDGFECTVAQPLIAIDAVADPSFELGPAGGVWTQTFPPTGIEPIDAQPGANTGDFVAWFGGLPDTMGIVNVASISQDVTIPAGASELTYAVSRQICDPNGLDTLTVRLGGNVVGELDCPPPLQFENYVTYTVDLELAPAGPYNDGGTYLLEVEGSTRGSDTNSPPIGLWTNFFVDDVSILTGEFTDPMPSVCTAQRDNCYLEDFDPGTGTLPADWTEFSTGALTGNWGTTDDGFCGSANVGPGNFSGGAGEAACIDSDALGGGAVNSYLCSPRIALENIGTTLDFKYNYQVFEAAGPDDAFEVLVGTDPPNFATIDGYTSIFFTNASQGTLFGDGASESLDLAAFERSEVHVCFRYGGDFDWYAHVDDVAVNADICGLAVDDSDGDGVPDDVDNCILDANPLQIDSNGDNIGNVCDGDIAGPAGPGTDDCAVAFFDLARMKEVFFTNDPDADLVGPLNSEPDGAVSFFDLGRMKELFFGPPGPSAAGCDAMARENLSEK